MAPISCLYAVPYLKMTPIIYLIQNKLIPTSLGADWTENEHFELVFAKTIIFMPKTRSINSGTVAPMDEGTILVYCCPSTVPSL
jgi:hypothetical protein